MVEPLSKVHGVITQVTVLSSKVFVFVGEHLSTCWKMEVVPESWLLSKSPLTSRSISCLLHYRLIY
jgi:hypothetical protein